MPLCRSLSSTRNCRRSARCRSSELQPLLNLQISTGRHRGTRGPFMKRSSDDRTFRIVTGVFSALVLLTVLGIGFELARQSLLSIRKFGFGFWTHSTWDPVSGEFGALPFIWGTLYSSIAALLLATPVALGIAIYISELSPRMLRQPLAYLTELLAAIPSIVYGVLSMSGLLPSVPSLEIPTPA